MHNLTFQIWASVTSAVAWTLTKPSNSNAHTFPKVFLDNWATVSFSNRTTVYEVMSLPYPTSFLYDQSYTKVTFNVRWLIVIPCDSMLVWGRSCVRMVLCEDGLQHTAQNTINVVSPISYTAYVTLECCVPYDIAWITADPGIVAFFLSRGKPQQGS
jgi:hypothetical protein